MNRALWAALVAAASLASAQEYILQDYMPMTIGSQWVWKITGSPTEGAATTEVLPPREIEGVQAMPVVLKGPNGRIIFGSLESVTLDQYLLLGLLLEHRATRGGVELLTVLYSPLAKFPGKFKVGQKEQAKVHLKVGQRDAEVTIAVQLEATEAVTVPKGKFDDCLKLSFTTTTSQGERKRTIWYAKGVGPVKSEGLSASGQELRTLELTDYKLGQ